MIRHKVRQEYDTLDRLKKLGFSRDVRDAAQYNDVENFHKNAHHRSALDAKRPNSYQGFRTNGHENNRTRTHLSLTGGRNLRTDNVAIAGNSAQNLIANPMPSTVKAGMNSKFQLISDPKPAGIPTNSFTQKRQGKRTVNKLPPSSSHYQFRTAAHNILL